MDGGGGWAAGGGLNLPLGVFGVAMSPRSDTDWSKHA